jgi:hypothetical protein
VATTSVGSCSTGDARGEKNARNCRDWQLGVELTGEWRTAAVLSQNPRGRVGCWWLEAAVRVRGAVGRLGRSRGGVGEEWKREDEWSSASGEQATWRQRDREGKRGKRWGSGCGGATRRGGCRGAWPRPVDGARQRPKRGARGRCVSRARVPAGQSGAERELTGGPRHSAGRRCR